MKEEVERGRSIKMKEEVEIEKVDQRDFSL